MSQCCFVCWPAQQCISAFRDRSSRLVVFVCWFFFFVRFLSFVYFRFLLCELTNSAIINQCFYIRQFSSTIISFWILNLFAGRQVQNSVHRGQLSQWLGALIDERSKLICLSILCQLNFNFCVWFWIRAVVLLVVDMYGIYSIYCMRAIKCEQ